MSRNSYCLLTEYGNNNPSQYLTRSFSLCGMSTKHMKIPGCTELMGSFNQTNMTDFHTYTEYFLHVDLHSIFGGAWECNRDMKEWFEEKPSRLGQFNETIDSVLMSIIILWEEKYAAGTITCPDYCGLEVPFSECMCSSSDETVSQQVQAKGGEENMGVDDWYELFMADVQGPLEEVCIYFVHGRPSPTTRRAPPTAYRPLSTGAASVL